LFSESIMATEFSEEAAADSSRRRSPQLDGESMLGLVRRLMEDLTTLFRQEMALATSQVMGALTRLTAGVASMALGGAMVLAGFMVLLAAAVLGLATVMEPWLAALIVGVVVTLIGAIVFFVGRKAADPTALKPTLSVESLRRDKEVITRSAS
jgi:hypothetical protein